MKPNERLIKKHLKIHEFINTKLNKFIYYLGEPCCTSLLYAPMFYGKKDINYTNKHIDSYWPVLEDFINGKIYKEVTGKDDWKNLINHKCKELNTHVKLYTVYKILKEIYDNKEPDTENLKKIYGTIAMVIGSVSNWPYISPEPVMSYIINTFETDNIKKLIEINYGYVFYRKEEALVMHIAKIYWKVLQGDMTIEFHGTIESEIYNYFVNNLGFRKQRTVFKISNYHETLNENVGYLFYTFAKNAKDMNRLKEVYKYISRRKDEEQAKVFLESGVLAKSYVKNIYPPTLEEFINQNTIEECVRFLNLFDAINNKYSKKKHMCRGFHLRMDFVNSKWNVYVEGSVKYDIMPQLDNRFVIDKNPGHLFVDVKFPATTDCLEFLDTTISLSNVTAY